jgi:ribulose-phosphate 3-epimerase
MIRDGGAKAGIAINPATPAESLSTAIEFCDFVLVMSVNPGFGGQSFIREALTKLRQARDLIGGRPIDLEVDGGISPENALDVVQAGADVLVAGSAIFAGNDPTTYARRIAAIRSAAATLHA